MIKSSDFKEIIEEIVREELGDSSVYKIGTIASDDGKPSIIFAGESQPSQKQYSFLGSYRPKIGERVLLVKTLGTYVVLGKINHEAESGIVLDQELELLNDWENYGQGFERARARKFENGIVQLSGLIRYGEYGASAPAAAILPEECRSGEGTAIFRTASGATGVGTVYIYGNSGEIRIVGQTGGWISLAGISFYAE